MKIGRKAAFILGLLAALGLAGCFAFFETSQHQGIFIPRVPKYGEKTILFVVAFDKDSSSWIPIEVILTDIEAERSERKVTNGEEGAIFNVVVGKEYVITARYKDSDISSRFIMEPGTTVVAFVKNNKIVDMAIYRTGIM